MRYFIGCISIALLLAYSGCSSTETVQKEEQEPTPVSSVPMEPSWYSPGVHSSSDSLALFGYSLASAADSSTAAELSTSTALEYLRFEIDKAIEKVRKELADSSDASGTYSSPSFIIQLRKSISELSLQSATLTHLQRAENDIYYSYTRSSIHREDLFKLLEEVLDDNRFLKQIRLTLLKN